MRSLESLEMRPESLTYAFGSIDRGQLQQSDIPAGRGTTGKRFTGKVRKMERWRLIGSERRDFFSLPLWMANNVGQSGVGYAFNFSKVFEIRTGESSLIRAPFRIFVLLIPALIAEGSKWGFFSKHSVSPVMRRLANALSSPMRM